MNLVIKINPDLELKILQLEDTEQLFELTEKNRTYLREWLSWLDENKTVEDTKRFIKGGLERFKRGTGGEFGIFNKGKLAGCIGLPQLKKDHKKAAIGYWLSKDFQGHGITTEVVKVLVGYLFNDLGLNRVEINCATGNKKSCAIPEKLGFKNEGIIRQVEWLYDHFVDWNKYSLLKSEWSS